MLIQSNKNIPQHLLEENSILKPKVVLILDNSVIYANECFEEPHNLQGSSVTSFPTNKFQWLRHSVKNPATGVLTAR